MRITVTDYEQVPDNLRINTIFWSDGAELRNIGGQLYKVKKLPAYGA